LLDFLLVTLNIRENPRMRDQLTRQKWGIVYFPANFFTTSAFNFSPNVHSSQKKRAISLARAVIPTQEESAQE
jgi:hypothetical protein